MLNCILKMYLQASCKLNHFLKIDDNLFIAEVNDTGVSFQCITNRVFYPFLKLQYKEKIIADSVTSNVHYTIPQVQCRHMGEYVCKAENTRTKRKQEKTIQLAVSNCQAQLCSTIDQSKTIKAKVHDNVTVSLCLIIYPEQPTQTKLYLNETKIGQTQLFNRHSWSLDTSGHLHKTVNVYIQDIKPEDFGVQYINVEFNGYNTTMLLNIQAEGPPLCPANLTIQEIGSDDVILSWTPGFNGGAEQKFRIVFKKLNETSQQTREVHETTMDSLGRMYFAVDNLESNTSYEFRVASSNRFGYQMEESSSCNVATAVTTAPCDKGKWGDTCQHSCSGHCLDPMSCHKDNGTCTGGCKEGYRGDTCEEDMCTDDMLKGIGIGAGASIGFVIFIASAVFIFKLYRVRKRKALGHYSVPSRAHTDYPYELPLSETSAPANVKREEGVYETINS